MGYGALAKWDMKVNHFWVTEGGDWMGNKNLPESQILQGLVDSANQVQPDSWRPRLDSP